MGVFVVVVAFVGPTLALALLSALFVLALALFDPAFRRCLLEALLRRPAIWSSLFQTYAYDDACVDVLDWMLLDVVNEGWSRDR